MSRFTSSIAGVLFFGLLVSVAGGCTKRQSVDLGVRQSALSETVTVTVVDSDGTPQAGILVTSERDGDAVEWTYADENGQASVLLAEGSYRFTVQLSGTTFPSGAAGHCVVPTCSEATITVSVPVTVTVTDTNQQPLAGQLVTAVDEQDAGVAWLYADDNGQIQASLLPGGYKFEVVTGGTEFFSGGDGHCVVPGCTSASITIPPPITVSVVDEGGQPVPGVLVMADETSAGVVAYIYADDAGHSVFSLHPGDYRFLVYANGAAHFSGDPGHCGVPGCTSATINIGAGGGGGGGGGGDNHVIVTVVDTDGVAKSGLSVTAVDGDGNQVAWVDTDTNGHADIGLASGSYSFGVTLGGTPFSSGVSGHCQVPTCTTATITVTKPVTITVANREGQGRGNTWVTATDDAGTQLAWSLTNENGVAVAYVPVGNYQFGVGIDGFGFSSGPVGHCVVPGCTTATILIPDPVLVTVRDCQGNPASGLTVYYDQGVQQYGDPPETTDDDGHARFWLPDGGYRFKARNAELRAFSGDPGHCVVPGCTSASITFGVCTGTCASQEDGTACNDGDPCTQTDTCQSGECTGTNEITCNASDQCHVAGVCSSASGTCTNPAAADGTACDDGDSTTSPDQCHAGVCNGGGAPSASAGADLALVLPANNAILTGSVSPPTANPTAPVTSAWTQVSGPAPAIFAAPTTPITGVTFNAQGTYVLRLTATSQGQSASDDVQVIVSACNAVSTPLDIVLLIDGSDSMNDENKLALAKQGAKSFVDAVDLTRDQISVIHFAFGATVDQVLSHDAAQVKTAIDGISTYFFTNIGEGLTAAMNELASSRHNSAATPLIVMLSDGGNSWGDPQPAIAALKAAGIKTVTIGLGSDVDVSILRQIAATSNDFYLAPTGQDLNWIYKAIADRSCRNRPPLVRTGPDMHVYSVRLPHVLSLLGEVHDPDPMDQLTSEWSVVSGPGPVSFVDASSPTTDALFPDPGEYVLRLTATDGFATTSADVTVTVDPEPSLTGAALVIALVPSGAKTIGSDATVQALLVDAGGTPIPNFAISFAASGVNSSSGAALTDSMGFASFVYRGNKVGSDQVNATALGGTTTLPASPITVQWTSAPEDVQVTQGWIGSPAHQATVTGSVPITVGAGVTLASGSVSYWPMAHPELERTLTSNAHGGAGDVMATLDTTTLANGPYVIKLAGTDNGGEGRTSLIAVTVTGDYKPGRMVFEVTDLAIPLPGIPLKISRKYDSLDRGNSGDFGHGWSLGISSMHLEADPAHNVTLTQPDGRRVTFYFTPTSYPSFFNFLLAPRYTPEAGVFGSLSADGCPLMTFSGGRLVCFLESSLEYVPTTYSYSDPYGRKYTLGASGELQKIVDLQGNELVFTATGITSNNGNLNVPFTRDSAGRITQITAHWLTFGNTLTYTYQYNAAGDLIAASLQGIGTATYEYDADHRLTRMNDPRGNPAHRTTFDDAGRMLTDTDALDRVTHYAYDLDNRTTQTTYPDTGIVTQHFDERGLLLSQVDALNRVTSFEYDSNRNKITRTNAAGESTHYAYDASGNQTSVTDPLGRQTTTTFNQFGSPISATDPLGHITTITYDENFVPTSFRDQLGIQASFTSSDHGLPLTVTDAAGQTAYLIYDQAGNLTGRVDRLGRKTAYQFDLLGHETAAIKPRGTNTYHTYYASGLVSFVGNTGPGITAEEDTYTARKFVYDANGNLTEQFAGFRHDDTKYTYDAANNLTSITFGDYTTQQFTSDFRGHRLTETDQQGRVTQHTYDLAGQLTRTTYPDGTFTTRSYDALGRLLTITDERGHSTAYEYEAGCGCSDRITKVTDPIGRVTETNYDALGRRLSTTDAAGHQTTFVYDLRGRLTETHYSDGTSVVDQYDAIGRRTQRTDQAGHVTHYGYDAEGQLTTVTDPLGNTTHYAYDDNGNLTTVTDPNNHTTTKEYDPKDRESKRTMPTGEFETFTYDFHDNSQRHVDFNGKTTTYAFDDLRRLVSRTPDSSLGETPDTYTYTATGQRASMHDASGTTSYTYDTRDRVLTKVTPQGTLTYTYDPTGNVATVRSSNTNGVSVDYAWDAANQLISITDNRTSPGVTTQNYTLTGQPQTRTEPNGIETIASYDIVGRLTNLSHQRNGSVVASYAHTLSSTGQRLSVTAANGRVATYGYDLAGRLTSEAITGDPVTANNGTMSYVLDGFGNRLSRTSNLAAIPSATYTYDPSDRVTSDSYDANGNTTASQGKTFTYDSQNRLVGMNSGQMTVTYDCDGTRVAKTVGGVTTRYLVDDLNPTGYTQVVEEVVDGATKRVYSYGSMLISQSQLSGSSWATSYYGYDGHGNVTFLSDATGAVTDSYDYDAFGNVVASTGTTANEYRYDGQRWDSDLGMYQLRARYYVADRGRFATIDPLKGVLTNPISSNKYLYANADSVNLNDPLGLAAFAEENDLATLLVAALQQMADVVLASGQVVGQNVLRKAVPVGVGLLIDCAFYTAWSGYEQIEAAKAHRIALDPPAPFQFCAVRVRVPPIADTVDFATSGDCTAEFVRCSESPLGRIPGRCADCLFTCRTRKGWQPRLPNGNICIWNKDMEAGGPN